jgi:DNA-binding transcriptional LysR family regulator
MLQFHQLRALDAIDNTRSFTAAAKQLEISQSSLSHAIAGMEKELGVRLFERGRYGAKPTEAGEGVLFHARQILNAIDAVYAEAASKSELLSGRIRIGSIPSAAVAFLPKVMAQFSAQYRHVDVVLIEEPSQGPQQLIKLVRDHTLDAAILELPLNELETAPLLEDELCALVPAQSSLARGTIAPMRRLLRQPLIMSRYTSERLLRNAFAGFARPDKIRFEVQDLATLVNLVREGLGVSIIPRLAFPSVPAGVALRSVSPRIKREVGYAVRSLDQMSPALRAFLGKAQELARSRKR